MNRLTGLSVAPFVVAGAVFTFWDRTDGQTPEPTAIPGAYHHVSAGQPWSASMPQPRTGDAASAGVMTSAGPTLIPASQLIVTTATSMAAADPVLSTLGQHEALDLDAPCERDGDPMQRYAASLSELVAE